MDLVSYADLAVRLVNTADPGPGNGDALASVEAYRGLVRDRPHLSSRVTAADLEALRLLRTELRLIFTAAASHREDEVAARLNALLTRHPIHQQITSHDGLGWHLHLVESGSTADKYAAAAITGLTGLVIESGMRRLRVCAGSDCARVFIAGVRGPDRPYCSDRCLPGAEVHPLPTHSRSGRQDSASPAAS